MARHARLIVLDTHVWLWHVAAPERLSARARAALANETELAVCTVSCWEVAMLAELGRIELDRDVHTWVTQALSGEGLRPVALSATIAVDAALLSGKFPGDPADRIIYASARGLGARLVTKDRALRSYDRTMTLW